MNKVILDKLKVEFETSDLSLDEIATKYNVDIKDLKGSAKWKKNLLEPKTKTEKKVHLPSHIDIVVQADIVTNDKLLEISDPDPDSPMDAKVVRELTDDLATDLIYKASKDIIEGKVPQLPTELKDGFEGLRKLDTSLQEQAQLLVNTIGTHLQAIEVGDTKALRDLAAVHTALRDSYFNSKNTMISVINGDVVQGDKNELATLLNGIVDDC